MPTPMQVKPSCDFSQLSTQVTLHPQIQNQSQTIHSTVVNIRKNLCISGFMQSDWLLNTVHLNEVENEKIPLLKSVICYKIIALIGIIFYFKRNEFLKEGRILAVSNLSISMKFRVKRDGPKKRCRCSND